MYVRNNAFNRCQAYTLVFLCVQEKEEEEALDDDDDNGNDNDDDHDDGNETVHRLDSSPIPILETVHQQIWRQFTDTFASWLMKCDW